MNKVILAQGAKDDVEDNFFENICDTVKEMTLLNGSLEAKFQAVTQQMKILNGRCKKYREFSNPFWTRIDLISNFDKEKLKKEAKEYHEFLGARDKRSSYNNYLEYLGIGKMKTKKGRKVFRRYGPMNRY